MKGRGRRPPARVAKKRSCIFGAFLGHALSGNRPVAPAQKKGPVIDEMMGARGNASSLDSELLPATAGKAGRKKAGRIGRNSRPKSPLKGTVDPKLLEILVCPLQGVRWNSTRATKSQGNGSSRSAKGFGLSDPADGIPIMLPGEEARKIDY